MGVNTYGGGGVAMIQRVLLLPPRVFSGYLKEMQKNNCFCMAEINNPSEQMRLVEPSNWQDIMTQSLTIRPATVLVGYKN